MLLQQDDQEWGVYYARLLTKAKERHQNKLKIRPKSDRLWFWKTLSFLLKMITFGKGPSLYDSFFTVIGRTIWLPGEGVGWEKSSWFYKYTVMSHEIDHLDYCFFRDSDIRDIDHVEVKDWKEKEAPWYWKFWYNFKYLFWPFPILWAYGRQDIEIRGYRRNMEAHIHREGELGEVFLIFIYQQFSTANYLWMATERRSEELIQKEIDAVKKAYVENRLRFG